MSRLLGAVCVLLGSWLAIPAAASACGIPLDADLTREQALLIGDGKTETLVVSLDLAPDFQSRPASVVFPVPSEPDVSVLRDGEELFPYLERVTAPVSPPVTSGSDGGDAAGAPPGVDVIEKQVIGGYDVTTLGASDPTELERYLAANGYEVPGGAGPILAEYTHENWYYAAIKLAPGADPGTLAPLELTFRSEELVYPTRLSELAVGPIPTSLWVLSDHRSETDGFETAFAGPVDSLSEAPPAALEQLLARAPYLTRLESAAGSGPEGADVVISDAATDEPFREGEPPPAEPVDEPLDDPETDPESEDAGESDVPVAPIPVAGTQTEDGGNDSEWALAILVAFVLGVGLLQSRSGSRRA